MIRILKFPGAVLIFALALQASAQSAVCYEAAREDLLLIDQAEALRLCCQMESLAPVRCFNAAKQETFMEDWEAINLCQCARSIEPALCYNRYQEQTGMSGFHIVETCRNDRFFPLPFRSYIRSR